MYGGASLRYLNPSCCSFILVPAMTNTVGAPPVTGNRLRQTVFFDRRVKFISGRSDDIGHLGHRVV